MPLQSLLWMDFPKAYELAHFIVKVKTIAPGGIQTDFAGRSMDGGMHDAYKTLVEKVSEGYSEEKASQFSTPDRIAEVIFQAATDNKDQLRYIAVNDALPCIIKEFNMVLKNTKIMFEAKL